MPWLHIRFAMLRYFRAATAPAPPATRIYGDITRFHYFHAAGYCHYYAITLTLIAAIYAISFDAMPLPLMFRHAL